jgi:hypothetical protein
MPARMVAFDVVEHHDLAAGLADIEDRQVNVGMTLADRGDDRWGARSRIVAVPPVMHDRLDVWIAVDHPLHWRITLSP